MKTRIFALAVSAALVIACDPYEKAIGGAPTITSVIATQTGALGGNSPAVNAVNAGGTWQLGIPTACDGTAISVANPLIFIGFNQLMDGASIQRSPADCTPAGGWLTVGGAALPAGEGWFTCYSSQSTIPGEYSYVVLFAADTSAPVSGFDAAVPLDGATTNTPYTFNGSVKDKSGTAVPIALAATVQFPAVTDLAADIPAGHCSTTTATACTASADCPAGETCAGVSTTSLDLSWTAPGCGTAVTGYQIQRAPNLVYSPGAYETIVPSTTATTFTDTGLTPDTNYWYRVIPLQGTVPGSLAEVEGKTAK